MNPMLQRRIDAYPAPDAVKFLRSHYFQYRTRLLANQPKFGYDSRVTRRATRWFLVDVLVQAARLLRDNGRTVKDLHGVGQIRQFTTMVWLAITIPCMPENYYKFEFYLPVPRRQAHAYLNRYETKGVLYKVANGWSSLGSESPVTDKERFAVKAEAAGLPIVRIVRKFADGADLGTGPLPKSDLFVKPVDGKGGRAAAAWLYDVEANVYRNPESGDELAESELLRRYARASRSGAFLMQDRVQIHPALADISLGIAATCRVITILNEQDVPEVVASAFRLPTVQGKAVDNIHAGGISSPVDLQTGELGPATDLGLKVGTGRVASHPANGARIAGLRLPEWDSVKDLCVRAHEAFRPRALVGWDVCVTAEGPVIIEANAQPCVDHIQRVHGAPLGTERFADLLAYRVALHSSPAPNELSVRPTAVAQP